MARIASRVFFALYLLALPVYCLARVWQNGPWLIALTWLIPLAMTAFGVSHIWHARGARIALALPASAFGTSLAAETLGATTGFPFGSYFYTDTLGAKIFGVVPALIPMAWMMIAYPAWYAAHMLAARAPARIAIAAWAVMAYDLSLDPRMVADGHWRWLDGGAYFGIPVSNFVGWFATAAVIFVVWNKIENFSALGRRGLQPAPAHEPRRMGSRRLQPAVTSTKNPNSDVETLPALAFIVLWLGEAMAQAVFWNGPLIALIVFVAMGLVGTPVLLQLLKRIHRQHK